MKKGISKNFGKNSLSSLDLLNNREYYLDETVNSLINKAIISFTTSKNENSENQLESGLTSSLAQFEENFSIVDAMLCCYESTHSKLQQTDVKQNAV